MVLSDPVYVMMTSRLTHTCSKSHIYVHSVISSVNHRLVGDQLVVCGLFANKMFLLGFFKHSHVHWNLELLKQIKGLL